MDVPLEYILGNSASLLSKLGLQSPVSLPLCSYTDYMIDMHVCLVQDEAEMVLMFSLLIGWKLWKGHTSLIFYT